MFAVFFLPLRKGYVQTENSQNMGSHKSPPPQQIRDTDHKALHQTI